MNIQSVVPVLNVRDVPASLRWLQEFGWRRTFTWNDAGIIEGAADENDGGPANFAGACASDVEMYLCQDGQGGRGEHGVWMSWWLCERAEVDAAYAKAQELGCETSGPPLDEPWGVREFTLHHPDGHRFRVSTNLRFAN